MKLSLQTERSSGVTDNHDHDHDHDHDRAHDRAHDLDLDPDDDDGTTDEVTNRDEPTSMASTQAPDHQLPESILKRRPWKKTEFETWKREVENLASLTFDIESSLRRSHSTAVTLGGEIDPIATRAEDAAHSLKQCDSHLRGIDHRLRTLSG